MHFTDSFALAQAIQGVTKVGELCLKNQATRSFTLSQRISV